MARKWVINDKMLKLANVELHRDISEDNTTTVGGGFWEVLENGDILLYDQSYDFGPITHHEFLITEMPRALKRKGVTLYFSIKKTLVSAKKDIEDGIALIKTE